MNTEHVERPISPIWNRVLLNMVFGSGAIGEVPTEVWIEVLGSLSEQQRWAVRGRALGFTYEEIGVFLPKRGGGVGVSRARAHQILEVALRKLRHPSRSRKLKPYLKRGDEE